MENENINEKKILDKFYIKIFIDYLEFSKKYISEFGIAFRPVIEIQMGTEDPTRLSVIDEEKENVSGDESGNSFLTSNSFVNNKSISCNLNSEKIRTFFYKSVKEIFGIF